jgi:uncharacterized membrane protein YtjA (UPF0391 family)
MLALAFVFLVTAVIAGILGLKVFLGVAAFVAKLLLSVFLVLFLTSLLMYFMRGRAAR